MNLNGSHVSYKSHCCPVVVNAENTQHGIPTGNKIWGESIRYGTAENNAILRLLWTARVDINVGCIAYSFPFSVFTSDAIGYGIFQSSLWHVIKFNLQRWRCKRITNLGTEPGWQILPESWYFFHNSSGFRHNSSTTTCMRQQWCLWLALQTTMALKMAQRKEKEAILINHEAFYLYLILN